jgi:hypothetical protein
MNTAAIKEGISYLTNNKGRQTAVVFDLKNRAVKEIMEDFMDTLNAMDALEDTTPRKSIDQLRSELLGSK